MKKQTKIEEYARNCYHSEYGKVKANKYYEKERLQKQAKTRKKRLIKRIREKVTQKNVRRRKKIKEYKAPIVTKKSRF